MLSMQSSHLGADEVTFHIADRDVADTVSTDHIHPLLLYPLYLTHQHKMSLIASIECLF